MATINDVAKLAGVSVATVSRLLNDTAFVNKDTSEKVYAAIKELNYRPNRIAQSLNTKKSLNIAMIVNDISNPITATYVKGVESVSGLYNYNFILCCTDFDIDKEKKFVQSLVEKQIDGIIMSPCGVSDEHVREAVNAGIPIVFITRRLHGINADYIKFDDYDGGYQLTKFLVDIGYTDIFAIGRDIYDTDYKNRLKGFYEVLTASGLTCDPSSCRFGDASMKSGYDAMNSYVEENGRLPEAVYATTGMIAAGVIKYCREKKISIPDEIGLVSFESFMEFTPIIDPSVTHYGIPIFELGTVAAEVLFNKINKIESEPKEIILSGRVKIGNSTIQKQ